MNSEISEEIQCEISDIIKQYRFFKEELVDSLEWAISVSKSLRERGLENGEQKAF